MVEVRFICIPSVRGVRCTLDGVTKLSDCFGFASFYDIAQGPHTFSIEPPKDMIFLTGEDAFERPFAKSGTTVIEWYGTPWPEDQPWRMMFTFAEVPWLMSIALPFALGAIIIGKCIAPIKYLEK